MPFLPIYGPTIYINSGPCPLCLARLVQYGVLCGLSHEVRSQHSNLIVYELGRTSRMKYV